MLIPGLVSITFRAFTPQQICALCEEAKLGAIEWGGDVHVPPDGGNAQQVRRMSADSGLKICSYGSYYRLGQPMDAFLRCLDTAQALGTDIVRIWGGSAPSASLRNSQRAALVDNLAQCCTQAQAYGIMPALEYHGNTLTDSLQSTRQLLAETASLNNLRLYWQPRWDWSAADTLQALQLVRPRLAHAHVFTWAHHAQEIERLPLEKGEPLWQAALPLLGDCHALLEFVQGDDPAMLLRDAQVLHRYAAQASQLHAPRE